MALKLNGTTYYSVTELIGEVGVSRQTLWRWRHEGKIPAGHRYRDGKVLFNQDEVEQVREFATSIEPISFASGADN